MAGTVGWSLREAISSSPWLKNAVLVYGPRKAGTTLFQNLLDGTEALLAYPAELKLKYFARHPENETWSAKTYYEHSRVPLVQSERFSVAKYHSLWSGLIASEPSQALVDLVQFDAWCVAQAREPKGANNFKIWCAKEVGGGRYDILAYWRGLFRSGKALFIVRDPLTTTRAVLNDRRRDNRRLSIREIAHETLDPLRTLRRQARYLDDPNVHFVVYEDLVSDPQQEMDKVADFLAIERASTLSRPTLFGEPIVVRTASRSTTEVFRSDASWRDDLTKREQRVVSTATMLSNALPTLTVDYEKLRAAIQARN